MDYSIEFEGEPQDVTVTVMGISSRDGFVRLNEDLAADPRFRPGMLILIDVSGLVPLELSPDGLEEFSEPIFRRDWDYPPKAVAIVAPDPQAFKNANLSRAYLGGSRSGRRVFASRDEALSWLREQRG